MTKPPVMAPSIVTICGSTRFRAEITDANRALTLAGYIVLAPGVFQHAGDDLTTNDKLRLDSLHMVKIDLAHWVYVVNPGGYVGESTTREIEWATLTGKPVCSTDPTTGVICAPLSELDAPSWGEW
ncbi:hypothetical protein ACFTSF_04515 [Kribbella sp. NPDC056951]|uniref:hypothetical protein n=1 Tax=Kribbella sp. NPDC056951 TaxID=3345978 RepID=UPI0036431017